MKDYHTSLEKLGRDAAEAAIIRDLAADRAKHELYDRLHQHLRRLKRDEIGMNSSSRFICCLNVISEQTHRVCCRENRITLFRIMLQPMK